MPTEEKDIQESDNTGPEEENRENVPARPPVPRYTVILLACIAAVVGAQMWADLPAGIPLTEVLFHQFTKTAYLAGFWKPVFLEDREYWRILTGVVLHGFLVHALMNSYVFYMFGKLFEFLSSRAHLAIVFLLSALGGSLLSLFFRPDGLSVGASGGILGLVSYLAVYAFRRRQFVSAAFRKSLVMNIGFIIIFGLMLFNVVDNYGHIGGLIVGAVYALFQIPSDPYKDPRKAGTFAELAGLAALGTVIAVSLFSIYLILTHVS